ncbi:DUF7344 domain-containing protein [Halomarina litorea]|uniref:DUF7344 domain-containing protein n=1 Tax=Halomarina litorea TaxID=2961595 RepID=UPI0020C2264E|nr:helix-turn-helix domain-containing protein [Halomarina sp. BCD28]
MDTTSELLDALSDPRRRRVVYALADSEDRLSVDDLAQIVADNETGRADPARVDRIHLTLVHNHLRRLADAGFLQYDEERETVAATSTSPEVETLVDAVRTLDATT